MVVVGLDEAGAGPAFGSLWAACVHIPDGVCIPRLTDSKKMSEKRRAEARLAILSECSFGLGEVTQAEIDARGLGEARRLVFERALQDFESREPLLNITSITVDGDLFRPYKDIHYECIRGADATIPCVSAASVLAKTSRDSQVLALCDAEPALHDRYKIRSNKGYLSKAHVEGLKLYGWSAHHRRSYRIKALGLDSQTTPSPHD